MAEISKHLDHMKEVDLSRFQSNNKHMIGNVLCWSPPTDVFKTENQLIIKIEIAGMKQSEIDINFEDDYLIIRGCRTESKGQRAYHQMEIRYGEFTSEIVLPKGLSVDKALAEYEDGFLVISIPIISATTIHIKG